MSESNPINTSDLSKIVDVHLHVGNGVGLMQKPVPLMAIVTVTVCGPYCFVPSMPWLTVHLILRMKCGRSLMYISLQIYYVSAHEVVDSLVELYFWHDNNHNR